MAPAERDQFENQMATICDFMAQPTILKTLSLLPTGDQQLAQLVQTYMRTADDRRPPLPLAFAEEFAKHALKQSCVLIPDGELLPETIKRIYTQTHGRQSESLNFYGDGHLHGIHAYRNALQRQRYNGD